MAKQKAKTKGKDGMHTAVVPTTTPVAPKATKADSTKAAPKPSLKTRVETFIRDAGPNGCSVNQIAEGLGLVNKDTDKVEAAKVMKQLRVQCRAVCGGASSQRSGRNAIYVLPN